MKKWFEEENLEIARRKKVEIWKQHQEAVAEVENLEQLETQRKKQEEANAEARRQAKS